MKYNTELMKAIILKSNISSTMAIYDKNNEELLNDGIIIEEKELNRIKKAHQKKNKLFLDGLEINKNKYILLSTYKLAPHIYFLHCKKFDEGYVCININNVILIVKYDDEYIPCQYDTKIQQIIKDIEELFGFD